MTPASDESRLRHPAERPMFIVSAVLNLVILVAAFAIVRYGGDWIEAYPRVAKHAEELAAAASALILAPFILTFSRNQRYAAVRANSLRVSRTQIPELYEDFERMCATLGMTDIPELYVSETALDGPSDAGSAWHVDYVILGTRYLQPDLEEVRDVNRFLLARELGRLRLGHTEWLDDILLAYIIRIPVLRNPLMHVRTYSHDRYAAYLAPDSVRGLVALASGRRALSHVDVDIFLQEALEPHGWRARAASLTSNLPRVAYRVQALARAGLLRRDTFISAPPSDSRPLVHHG